MSDKADILLALGEPKNQRDWPDYPATYGLGADDVPRLIEILRDESLHSADGDSTEVWAPLHAWRALGQLGATEAIEPLISQFAFLSDDDWALSEIDRVFAMIGPAAVEPLATYLGEPEHGEFARIMAVDALAQIGMAHPDQRERVLAAYRDYMQQPDHEAKMLNGALMGRLIDLDAVELIDDIRRLFAWESWTFSTLATWRRWKWSWGFGKRVTRRPPRWPTCSPTIARPPPERPTSAKHPRSAAMIPAPVAAERNTSAAVCTDGTRPTVSPA